MKVYKFLTRQYGLMALTNRRLKVSEILKANDPFELLPFVHDNEMWREYKKGVSESYEMLCFCKSPVNPVVWAHYAECHRGFCLCFEIPDDHQAVADDMYFKGIRLKEMSYQSTLVNFPENIADEDPIRDKLFFTKHRDWAYEDEVRLYVTLRQANGGKSSAIRNGLDGHYFWSFSKEFVLKEIIAGYLNTDSKRLIHAHLVEPEYPEGDIKIWKVRPSDKGYAMVEDETFSRNRI